MSTKQTYQDKANELIKIIDIAIESFRIYPPSNTQQGNEQFINGYLGFKQDISNAENRFKNLQSLAYKWNDVLFFFQEGSGKTVELFWKKIDEENIDCKRENKMAKILKRRKIKNQIEYDFVIDCIVPYQQQGLINEEEASILNQLIDAYESRGK
ncbi:hypothetical protein VRU48_15555 [Pedobacter sp. KR3-3]|uniref:Uncharacterized protein n=1 Tax=Pedobacter albus TaxID=3113905 RepID=A0ABU7IB82_9SPHI|nr:hypothetical protein [Pedobacter sp. KR3-3]MEE1946541.1 hypothetical protein [Pedobacter sp. KR3-3]